MADFRERSDYQRKHVSLHADHVSSVTSNEYPGSFPGEDLSWNLASFKKNFKIVVTKLEGNDMEFDMIGVDASVANAFRRILIAEVPTMAIERVYSLQNTSIVQDEIVAQRLGLIPIKADPREFEWERDPIPGYGEHNDVTTISFRLNVACKVNPDAPVNAVEPADKYLHSSVYSRDIVFVPSPTNAPGREFKPVHPDILIAKMRPNQMIEMDMHAVKGIGKDHAKFSPVATASYRLLPEITILEPITGDDAENFVGCFPPGVAEVFVNDDGEKEARIVNPRKDTVSREVLRHPEFADKVRLGRVRDHFIFSVESTGILPPDELFREAVKILKLKCQNVKKELLLLSNP
ncbi:DNA-directed RNA polymerase [Hyaloraphidium curvatum]|nr:DNA-directed RNA polymerase [Hyaloraphidium curvatum]